MQRWNYWAFFTPAHALAVTVADLGWLGLVIVSFQETSAGRPVDRVYARAAGLPVRLPDAPGDDLALDVRGLRLEMRTRDEAMRVRCEARTLRGRRIEADLVVGRPRAHESLDVLVPWDDTHFQLTSKQHALPVRGRVRIDGGEHVFGEDGFAAFDFGRGRWPRRVSWYWAFASARCHGRTVGLNLGGAWTDGTGVTENGFVLDGRLQKVHEDVDFEHDTKDLSSPWRIRSRTGGRVDLRFEPQRERAVRMPLGVVGVDLRQLVGRFTGVLVADDGGLVRLDDAAGQAERFRARW